MILPHPVVALSLAIAACLGVPAARAAALPVPDGAYAVGVARSEFVDASRHLDPADPASGPRRLPAVVWYPAQGEAPAQPSAYLQAEDAAVTLPALARLFAYPAQELQALAETSVAARPDARPAREAKGFPVVVYSHGLFLYPEQNSALAARLASHGYIVVSIAHPGDSADVRLEDGRVVATRAAGADDDTRFTEAWNVLAGEGDGLAPRRQALATYADAQPRTRIGRSAVQWRLDTVFVAGALSGGDAPEPLRGILATADRQRLGFAGMSFGGATAASGCRQVPACRAAVNLDGQNVEADLYDSPVGRPLLLMLSDWPRYGLFPGQPREPDFSPNDLAYEPWDRAGTDPQVLRLRLQGVRHMGYTELGALMGGPQRAERFGDLAPEQAMATVGDVVLAFLDAHLRDGDGAAVDAAIARHPDLVRHVPGRLQRWAEEARAAQP